MADRRPLVEGLREAAGTDRAAEAAFVFNRPRPGPAPKPAAPPRVPLTTRLRADYAAALKRASLERQLAGAEPSTVQDILEEAVGPWLAAHGYLPEG